MPIALHSFRWIQAIGVVLMVSLCFAGDHARAENELSLGDLERAYDKVLANPKSIEAALEYARIAAQLEDYEAAISSLERILLFEPDHLIAQVELGVLYFRLQSYEAAAGYFESALDHPELPDDTSQRIEDYLASIRRLNSTNQFAASLSVGLRYQTNANQSPDQTILAFGTPTALAPEFAEKDDFSVFGSGLVRHRYDFGGQGGDYLESNIAAFASRQFELDTFNTWFLSADVGPRITLDTERGLSVRPYVGGALRFLDDRYYRGSIRSGADFGMPLSEKLTLGIGGEGEFAAYDSSDDRPNADELDGVQVSSDVSLTYRPSGSIVLRLFGEGELLEADADFESFGAVGGGISAGIEFPAPLVLTNATDNWAFNVQVRGFHREYDAADPSISATVRRDNEFRFDAQLFMPLASRAGLFAGIGWQRIDSNIPNYSVDNFTALSGLRVQF